MEKEEVSRRRGGKTVPKSGQRWILQLKTEEDGKCCCKVICGAQTTREGYGID